MEAPAPVHHIEIIDGNAIITRRHLKAEVVAAMVVYAGATIDETMAYYELTRSEVHAALTYYYDNKEAIDRGFAEAEAYVRAHGTDIKDKIAELQARMKAMND